MTQELQIKQLEKIISTERLSSYKFMEDDSIDIQYKRYLFNVQISEAFYPVLSALEIALRNNLYRTIVSIYGENWLLEEVENKKVLSDKERSLVIDAHKKLVAKSIKNLIKINKKKPIEERDSFEILKVKAKLEVKTGGIIAELTFGFWVNLCKKTYKNDLWDKVGFFDRVFPDFNKNFHTITLDKTQTIFPELKNILQLRNRIFHHEIIINNKMGIEYCYQKIELVLSSLSENYASEFMNISRFKDMIKQKP